MANMNPFSNLRVHYEDDAEHPELKPNVPKEGTRNINANLTKFNAPVATEQRKKKKVRPEEKTNIDDVYHPQEDIEGFSVVRKKGHAKPKSVPVEDTPDLPQKEHRVKSKAQFEPKNNRITPAKREFERHSGTGRGKEISKGGAGGKYTWGDNPSIIKDEAYHYADDNVFSYVLNASVKKVVEEQKDTAEKEGGAPQEFENPVEITEGKYEEKRRLKKDQPVEVNEEDRLERPENALTYQEYLAQNRQRNQALYANEPKTSVERPPESLALNPQQKNEESQAIGLSTTGQKKQTKIKVKEHKVDKTENELNKVIADTLTLTKDEPRRRDYGNRGTRERREENGPKFRFNAEEFPEL